MAERWRFWQSSPAPYPRFVELAVSRCCREEVVRWLEHLETCDRERENDVGSGAFVRRRWLEARQEA